MVRTDLQNLENCIVTESLFDDFFGLGSRWLILLVTEFIKRGLHFLCNIEVVLCDELIDIDGYVIRVAILENGNIVLAVLLPLHIRVLCHENYNTLLDAVVQKVLIESLMLLTDLGQLFSCQRVKHVQWLSQLIDLEKWVVDAPQALFA